MIRKRFPWVRRGRIAAWTVFAVTWATAVVARTLGAPANATVVESTSIPPPETVETVVPSSPAGMPDLPLDGLVIVRYTPAERPEPEVQRVVVTAPAPTRTAAPAPTTQRSSGS